MITTITITNRENWHHRYALSVANEVSIDDHNKMITITTIVKKKIFHKYLFFVAQKVYIDDQTVITTVKMIKSRTSPMEVGDVKSFPRIATQ